MFIILFFPFLFHNIFMYMKLQLLYNFIFNFILFFKSVNFLLKQSQHFFKLVIFVINMFTHRRFDLLTFLLWRLKTSMSPLNQRRLILLLLFANSISVTFALWTWGLLLFDLWRLRTRAFLVKIWRLWLCIVWIKHKVFG